MIRVRLGVDGGARPRLRQLAIVPVWRGPPRPAVVVRQDPAGLLHGRVDLPGVRPPTLVRAARLRAVITRVGGRASTVLLSGLAGPVPAGGALAGPAGEIPVRVFRTPSR